MKSIFTTFLAGSTLLLGACATTVKPTYVSPTQYQALNCPQLQSEYNRIQQYLNHGVPTEKRTGVGVGVGLGGWLESWWWLGVKPKYFCQRGTVCKHSKN